MQPRVKLFADTLKIDIEAEVKRCCLLGELCKLDEAVIVATVDLNDSKVPNILSGINCSTVCLFDSDSVTELSRLVVNNTAEKLGIDVYIEQHGAKLYQEPPKGGFLFY